MKRKVSIYQPQKKCFPRNAWFDDECKKKKRIVNDAKRAFLLDNTAITKSIYFVQKREYKNLIKFKKRKDIEQLHSKLVEVQRMNPAEFWKLENKKRKQKLDNVIQEFCACILIVRRVRGDSLSQNFDAHQLGFLAHAH